MKKTILSIVMATLCLISTIKAQQVITLTGRIITSPDSKPLPGATIKIKQGRAVVLSNSKGTFTIKTTLPEGILIISYTGYRTAEIPFGKTSTGPFTITLYQDESSLKEVEINAGYYTVKDKERTGSISRVTAETIGKQPVSNPLAALIGRMAGVNIEQQSGINGGGFRVEIRGINSLRTDARQPLYLIDGVPYPAAPVTNSAIGVGGLSRESNPLNYINPADIESIEVLKDADATAIYGSRGANGVILIKTRGAKAGKSSVDVNVYHGVSQVATKLKLLNTEQYLEMRNEAFKNDGILPGLTDYDVNGTWSQSNYTDWQKVLIGGTARSTNAQVAINGGGQLTQFVFRGNYNKQTTVSPGDFADQKGSGSLNINHNSSNQKFKVSFASNYAVDQNKLPVNDLAQYINLPPNAPAIYDTNGNLNWALNANGAATWVNPLASDINRYLGNTNLFTSSGLLNYEALQGLFLRTSLGYTNLHLRENLVNPIIGQAPSLSATGLNLTKFNTIETWIIEPQINYKRKLNKGTFDILAGLTFQKDDQKMETLSGIGYTSDLLLGSITSAPKKSAGSSSSQYKYSAFFGRINYNYDDKYLINITGRRDGSSKFGPGRQFANFGAIGLGWLFTSENIIKDNIPFLSFGKLRGSYGLTGSDQIPNYGYLETYSATVSYQDGSGLFPGGLANADYSWETNKKLEGALELGFINDRILFSTSFYRNRSSNQLVGYNLPDITGFPTIQYNLPATVQNTGWEFEINATNLSRRSFTWRSSLNLTIPRNKLLSYPNIAASSYSNTYTVGESLFTPRSYHYLGVNTQTGVYMVEDRNASNTIEIGDRSAAYTPLTTHLFGGLQNSINYKGFSFDFFFQFVSKTERKETMGNTPGLLGNQLVEVMKRWKESGDQTDIQKFTQSFKSGGPYTTYGYSGASDRFVNASFIRLKNIAVSWTPPIEWIQSLKLNNIRVYLQGQNIFTITNYLGDPEIGNLKILPSLRTITAGLQVGF